MKPFLSTFDVGGAGTECFGWTIAAVRGLGSVWSSAVPPDPPPATETTPKLNNRGSTCLKSREQRLWCSDCWLFRSYSCFTVLLLYSSFLVDSHPLPSFRACSVSFSHGLCTQCRSSPEHRLPSQPCRFRQHYFSDREEALEAWFPVQCYVCRLVQQSRLDIIWIRNNELTVVCLCDKAKLVSESRP